MPLNLPNLLTWMRIAMIPAIVGVFYLPDSVMSLGEKNVTATALFVAAALTDWLDGYLARRLNQMSAFGAFLDPVADKLMVAAALILLVELDRTNAAVAIVIIGREIGVSALREWMARIGEGRSVAVNVLGKIKTISQMVAIPMLLYHGVFLEIDMRLLGTWLIYIAVLLTVVSMFYYLKMAAPPLRR
ncbi:MAG: CDP-diacylglycerol--glycerol-3-phosphate 3-phosphatidyltransferase [Betaproteobacteria bacterium]|nr:CDP-diacylglycerol--glycerol-3-phosphate 3-phosphatidyltransferase [Betaproteobacteria bacterium]